MENTPSSTENSVYLIGFGPGDPDLLTLKAIKILKKADAIYFDDLITQEFLEQYTCEKHYVGKRKGAHHKSQDEINALLFKASKQHKTVVRLKGGDPFIFGRGGEELAYLAQRKVNVKIIPGVTASMAAAASVQIPLTQRGVSKYLTFLPGHNIEKEHLHFPNEGTMVFYMAASKLEALSTQFLEAGKSPLTPVALVQNASLQNEKVEITNIKKMYHSQLGSPLVVIIGEVVNLK